MSDKPEKLQELLTQVFITEQEYQYRLAALTTATNNLSLNAADENQSEPKSNAFNFSFDNSSTTNSKNEQAIFSFGEPTTTPNVFASDNNASESDAAKTKTALETEPVPTFASSLSWGSSIGTSSFKVIIIGDGGIGKTVTLFIFPILATAFTD